jgi:purine-binding chemotaxis protein CheW
VFDASFAVAARPGEAAAELEHLLTLRLADETYALRLSEIGGVFADKRVSAVPSSVHEFVGLAGFRGALLPVYDLGALLGYTRPARSRWLIVSADRRAAFTFDALEGHLRIARGDVVSAAPGAREHIFEVARAAQVLPVLRLASVLDAVERNIRELHRIKER